MLNDKLITGTVQERYEKLIEELAALKGELFKPKPDVKALADDFATDFIINHTSIEVDSNSHRTLVNLFILFAEEIQNA